MLSEESGVVLPTAPDKVTGPELVSVRVWAPFTVLVKDRLDPISTTLPVSTTGPVMVMVLPLDVRLPPKLIVLVPV
jgi:hypothetical protein